MTTRGSGRRGGWAVPGRAPRSRGRASGGTGQARVRARTPPARTWTTGPSSRRVTRCPASGSPALMMRSPRLTLPEAFTVRSTSVTSPDAGGSGGGPAGLGSGGGEAGQVTGIEPGRQGLDAVAVEQDVDLAQPGPEPDGAAGHRRARARSAVRRSRGCPMGNRRSSSTAWPCPVAAGVRSGAGQPPRPSGSGSSAAGGEAEAARSARQVCAGRDCASWGGKPGGGEGHGQ